MAEFSDEFKINVNKLNADEAVLVCIEIRHPFISDVIRIVNDSDNLISNRNTYLPMGFEFKRHDDVSYTFSYHFDRKTLVEEKRTQLKNELELAKKKLAAKKQVS